MIREMTQADGERILEIYKIGLSSRNATFETDVPSWTDWDTRHHKHSRFVYVIDDRIAGWIAISPVSARKAYNGVAEISIYIDPKEQGKGIGSELMEKVINSSERNGIWSLYSSVFPENTATIKLHEKYGFRMIGWREKIAQLDGHWRDTILFEKRSDKVGI